MYMLTIPTSVGMLERARLVDTSNNWSKGTLRTYKSKFNVLRDFKRDLHVRVIPFTPPTHASNGPAIHLMWAQERHALYPSDWWKRNRLGAEAIKFGTIRALCSAASHFWTIDLLHTHADQLTFGFKDRHEMVQACSPTDQVTYTYFTEGMRRQLGGRGIRSHQWSLPANTCNGLKLILADCICLRKMKASGLAFVELQ
jgi:hypothetical protein